MLVVYSDVGLRNERPIQIVCGSALFPDAVMMKSIFYHDVGKLNQRIDKIEYTGPALSPDGLRKVFQYSMNNGKYKKDGFYYETF